MGDMETNAFHIWALDEFLEELSTDTENELLDEQPVFKVPEEAPAKTRKSKKERATAIRRQKSRACKSTVKSYEMDFSDDAE